LSKTVVFILSLFLFSRVSLSETMQSYMDQFLIEDIGYAISKVESDLGIGQCTADGEVTRESIPNPFGYVHDSKRQDYRPFDCNPLTEENFCAQVKERCLSLYEVPTSLDEGAQHCVVESEDKIEELASDDRHMWQALTNAEAFLESLKSDEVLKKRCCCKAGSSGNEECNSSCISDLGEVSLNVAVDATQGFAAYYRILDNDINLSMNAILKYQNKEGLESIIRHEFGHACQFNGLHHDSTFRTEIISTNLHECSNIAHGEFSYDRFANPALSTCLIKEVTNSDLSFWNDYGKYEYWIPGCKSQRLREAFADTIFIESWNTPFHFTHSCANPDGDGLHHPFTEVLQCLFESGQFPGQFCSS
jgi:hypothetical protein